MSDAMELAGRALWVARSLPTPVQVDRCMVEDRGFVLWVNGSRIYFSQVEAARHFLDPKAFITYIREALHVHTKALNP